VLRLSIHSVLLFNSSSEISALQYIKKQVYKDCQLNFNNTSLSKRGHKAGCTKITGKKVTIYEFCIPSNQKHMDKLYQKHLSFKIKESFT